VIAGGATTTVTTHEIPWWWGATGYQIYIRSFHDASGDGVGDLAGIRDQLPYIGQLGVDVVWITPFYPSPQADHGYDVADYTDVDPTFGTLDEFRALVADAHELGLRVIIDLVPNHTSDRHPWFLDARRGRDAEHRDYYVWRDPGPDGGPPNNWVSKFGGPAWTFHAATGQYYLHHFLPEQPDLNWSDARVRAEFDRIVTFWLDHGVDGFRIDTAHLLVKDADLRDNPRLHDVPAGAGPEAVYDGFDHRHDTDQAGVLDVYRRWHELVAARGAMLLGEVALLDPRSLTRYVEPGVLDLAFYFPTLKAGWDAEELRAALVPAVEVAGQGFAWPLSSHDDPRAAHRFGGGALGERRSLAYLTLLAGLPGTVFVLQGDELGLDHGELADVQLRDPVSVRNGGAVGRDGSRTPMPWNGDVHLGFSTVPPWLPVPRGRTAAHSVAVQGSDEGSPLHRTRRLFATRRALPELRGDLPVRWLTDGGPVIAFRRGDTVVVLNTAATGQELDLGVDHELRFSSLDGAHVRGSVVALPPDTAVIATRSVVATT
jgi:alpha-glucosidase